MKLSEALTLAFGSQAEKSELWRNLSFTASHRYGFYVYDEHMAWKDQDYFLKAKAESGHIGGIPDPRLFVLQSCIRSLAEIEGDVAECGVRRGRSTYFMLTADLRKRQYHLFDSFEGLSEPSAKDETSGGMKGWKKHDLSTDEAEARRNLVRFSDLHFHVGWIPQTLGAVADRKFALVHIDVDLYEPTRDSLEFFFDRTVSGGIVVCDDYGSKRCPGARAAFDEFVADRPEKLIELPTGQALIYKR